MCIGLITWVLTVYLHINLITYNELKKGITVHNIWVHENKILSSDSMEVCWLNKSMTCWETVPYIIHGCDVQVGIKLCTPVSSSVWVSVCVSERERERVCVCARVCVCVRVYESMSCCLNTLRGCLISWGMEAVSALSAGYTKDVGETGQLQCISCECLNSQLYWPYVLGWIVADLHSLTCVYNLKAITDTLSISECYCKNKIWTNIQQCCYQPTAWWCFAELSNC